MRGVLDLVPVVLDEHPELPDRTLAVLCGDAYVPWGSETIINQRTVVEGAERLISLTRLERAGLAPEFTGHDEFVWALARWLDIRGWRTLSEWSVRVSTNDRNPKRADLIVSDTDDEWVIEPRFVVEVKTQIRGSWQAQAAVDQVLAYCCGFAREYGCAPTPVVVCPDVSGTRAPRQYGVPILSPQEFVDWIGAPERDEVAA